MKIGWIKFTMNLEFDFNTAKTGAGQERGPIARTMVHNGHKITVYTPLTKVERKVREEVIKAGKQVGDWDNTFLKDMGYEPTKLPTDLDVLIIENAALNLTFYDKANEMPQLRRTVEVINAHKGLCIFTNGDPDLPFPFWKLAGCKMDWKHKKNPYRLDKDTSEYTDLELYGWATHDEIFKNKTWVFAIRSEQTEEVVNSLAGGRCRLPYFVEKGLVNVESMFTGQTNEFFDKFKVREEPTHDVLCQGYPRNREKDFEDLFLYSVNYFNLAATGQWDKGKNVEFRDMCVEYGVNILGFVDGLQNLYKVVNDSMACIHIGVGKTKKLGWLTGRWLETIFCKSICLWDDKLAGYDKYLDRRFSINKDNADKRYKGLKSLSYEDREKLWAYQYDMVKHLTIKTWVDEFEAICKKYKVKVTRNKKLRAEYKNVWVDNTIEHKIKYKTFEIDDIFALMEHNAETLPDVQLRGFDKEEISEAVGLGEQATTLDMVDQPTIQEDLANFDRVMQSADTTQIIADMAVMMKMMAENMKTLLSQGK